MSEAINQIRQISGQTVNNMNDIFLKLSEMSASFTNIRGTIEMQVVKSGQITDALKIIRDLADEVSQDSERIQRDSSAIDGNVKNLRSASGEMNRSANAAQEASRQIATSFSMAKKIVDGVIIIRPDKNT